MELGEGIVQEDFMGVVVIITFHIVCSSLTMLARRSAQQPVQPIQSTVGPRGVPATYACNERVDCL